MEKREQAKRAERFRALHGGPGVLVLPNAWDAASARVFEEAGFAAVATTSAGLANALGYADGEQLTVEELAWMVERITRVVRVPVSVDFEAGFSRRPEEVAKNCTRVLEAGGIGINLEDSGKGTTEVLEEVVLIVEKIRAVREAGEKFGVPVVINARTDVYLEAVGEAASRLEHAARRLNAYREAGADCLFAPGVTEAKTIGELVRAVEGPLNILGTVGTPPVRELERLGVRRVSVGSGPMRATLGLLKRIAGELRSEGTFTGFTEGAMAYAEANRLFERAKGETG